MHQIRCQLFQLLGHPVEVIESRRHHLLKVGTRSVRVGRRGRWAMASGWACLSGSVRAGAGWRRQHRHQRMARARAGGGDGGDGGRGIGGDGRGAAKRALILAAGAPLTRADAAPSACARDARLPFGRAGGARDLAKKDQRPTNTQKKREKLTGLGARDSVGFIRAMLMPLRAEVAAGAVAAAGVAGAGAGAALRLPRAAADVGSVGGGGAASGGGGTSAGDAGAASGLGE